MKKIFLFLAVSSLVITSCRSDDSSNTDTSLETQNSYDDQAAQKFLNDNYFDARGNVVAFDSSITTDDNEVPLAKLNPVKLPSGVIYISRYTPTNGKAINATDKIRWMVKSTSYVGTKSSDGTILFDSGQLFRNTITSTGTPEVDPAYFYVKTSVLNKYNTDNSTNVTRSFYEMEGLQEGLKYFQSCEIPDSDNYNLQGVIIVPSRAAYARDLHYPFASIAFTNRSFVFNFQVYKTDTRTSAED